MDWRVKLKGQIRCGYSPQRSDSQKAVLEENCRSSRYQVDQRDGEVD